MPTPTSESRKIFAEFDNVSRAYAILSGALNNAKLTIQNTQHPQKRAYVSIIAEYGDKFNKVMNDFKKAKTQIISREVY